jgi:hypothetical protein
MLIALSVSCVFSSGQIENPDTHVRLSQSRLLVEGQGLGLTDDTGDIQHGNIAINDSGERFMVYNPGQSFVFIPFYWISTLFSKNKIISYYNSAFLVSFINLIVHVFSCYILFLLAQSISKDKKKSILVALAYGLTSYAFSFAQHTYEHHFETLFTISAFYYAFNSSLKNHMLFAGLFIGVSLIFRTTSLFCLPGVLLLARTKGEVIRLMIFPTLGLLLILLYNKLRFNHLLESGYSIAWHLAHGKTIMEFWSPKYLLESTYGLILSPGKGILIYSPTLLLGLVYGGNKLYKSNHKLVFAIITTVIVYVFIIGCNFAWHGSIWSFGPRYILPILPLLYLSFSMIKPNKLIASVLILGFGSQVLLTTVNYKRDLLEQYVQDSGIDDISYIKSIYNIPYIIAAKQLAIILPKNFNTRLKNYQPFSVWKNEAKNGTNEEVLENSIEKNSLNYWWVRIFHWNSNKTTKILSLVILGISIGYLSFSTFKMYRKYV